MKKVTIALSALGVAATVSTAIAHTTSMGNFFCVARELNDDTPPVLTIITYIAGGSVTTLPAADCANILTVQRTQGTTGSFTMYGYAKTTLPGAACQTPPATGCQRLRLNPES